MKKERNILLIGQKLKRWELPLNIKDYILGILETYGGKISCWAWNKRWSKRNDVRYRSSKTGKYYTIDKKTGLVKR